MMFKRKDKTPATRRDVAPQKGPKDWDRPSLSASRELAEYSDGRTARAIIWTVVLGIGLFIYWAAMTPVYEIITGNGVVRPEGLSTRIEHPEGGAVSSINFSQGERVAKGDVLMRLDDAHLLAELQKAQAKLDGIDQNIKRYTDLLALNIAQTAVEIDLEAIAATNTALFEEVTYRIAQIETLRSQRNVVLAQKNTIMLRLMSTREELVILQGQLARYGTNGGQRVIPLSQLEDIRREELRLKTRISEMMGQIEEKSATMKQMRSVETEVVAQYRSEAALTLASQIQERITTVQTLSQIQDRIMHSAITAPVSGYINILSVQNIGEVVSPGEVIAEIIPENTHTFAEIEIPAHVIGGVSLGQKARMKVLTYDFTRFGDVSALVERISPSSFTRENGDVFFRVRLSFAADEALNLGENTALMKPISPGMTVVADIRSESRSILTFLLKPFRLVVDQAFSEA